MLWLRSRTCKPLSKRHDTGSVPLSLLPLRRSMERLVKSAHSDGTPPENMLSERSIEVRLGRVDAQLDGSWPRPDVPPSWMATMPCSIEHSMPYIRRNEV